MYLLFDENVPYKFVKGLALIEQGNHKSKIQVNIFHPKDLETEGNTDEQHIEFVGKKQGILISFDKDFRHMKSYYPLYREYKVGAVIVNLSKSDSNYWGIVKSIINRWEDLKIQLKSAKRPFIFEITSRGIERREF